MAAAASPVGLGLMPSHGRRAAFLWVVVLVTVTNADSDGPPLNSPTNSMTNQTTGSSLSASPFTASWKQQNTSSNPLLTHDPRTMDITQKDETTTFSENSSLPWSPTKTKPPFNSHPEFTNHTPHNPSPSQPPWPNSTLQNEPSLQHVAIVSSFPGHSLEPSNVAFSDYQADHAIIPTPDTETTSNALDRTHITPSISPSFSNLPFFLAPGYNVVTPHPVSPMFEATESPPDDIFPTDSLDIDWGSGDYLETMSYMGSDGGDYSLVTRVPAEMFDMDEDTESYDTSFPTRVGVSLTSMQRFLHSPSFSTALFSSHFAIHPTPSISPRPDIAESANSEWQDHFTIEPTDVLLPDMNSLEYYSTQQESSNSGAEQRGNVTVVEVADIAPTMSFDGYAKDESSSEVSGMEPGFDGTEAMPTNVSKNAIEPSQSTSHFSSMLTTEMLASTSKFEVSTNATTSLTDEVVAYSSLTDVHWFVTEPYPETTMLWTPVSSTHATSSPVPSDSYATSTTFTTESPPMENSDTTIPDSNATLDTITPDTPVTVSDQGTTEDGGDIPATLTSLPETANTDTGVTTAPTTANTTPRQDTPEMTTASEMSKDVSISNTIRPSTTTQAARQYLCDVTKPEYLVKIGFPFGATVGYAKSQVRDILKAEFNKSLELQMGLL